MEATPTNLLLLRKRITARLFSHVPYGSAPSVDSVRELRLMFSVYSLLWQLSILLLTVLESLPFSCMLTVDIFSSQFSVLGSCLSFYALKIQLPMGRRGEIPFHVIGRKYTEGTTLGHMRTTLQVYMYIEGEAWQEPLQEKQGYTV